MADIHVKVIFSNNLLLARIKEHCGDIPLYKVAEQIGISYGRFHQLLRFKINPLKKNKIFEWRESVEKIARFLDCNPNEIFPPAFYMPRKSTFELELESKDFISWNEPALLAESTTETPESYQLLKEQMAGIPNLLNTIKPREEEVIRLRFGLNENGEQLTLRETAKRFGITTERVRQIESRALRKLRHPYRRQFLMGEKG